MDMLTLAVAVRGYRLLLLLTVLFGFISPVVLEPSRFSSTEGGEPGSKHRPEPDFVLVYLWSVALRCRGSSRNFVTVSWSGSRLGALTCQAACVLLPVPVHLALVAGQNLLHQVQHPKVLHHVVQQHCIWKNHVYTDEITLSTLSQLRSGFQGFLDV